MYKWYFRCTDNGGKRQSFEVKASTKAEAVRKAFDRARKNATGNIYMWDCKLLSA